MNRILTGLLSAILLFASCKKEDKCPHTESGVSASNAERAYLQNYLSNNSLAATEHSSGVFYNITAPGTGNSPGICSNIKVFYTGSILGGNTFDSNVGTSGNNFTLGELIVGWQKVLPLLKSGGKIILYIPPSLGYGANPVISNGVVVIPANSYLKFEIELVNIQ